MSPAEPSQQFPRLPLFSAALLIGTALVLVATVRLTGVGQSHTPDAPTIAERDLRFLDRADGGVNVIDARSGELVSSVEGQQGFLRGTLLDFPRQALHAARLGFAHPRTGAPLSFETPLPADMAGLIAALDA